MEKTLEIMMNRYREACRDHYETMYGEKVNTKYTIKNMKTGEVISGSTSGRRDDDTGREIMLAIKNMMIQIFGDQVAVTLEEIRKEERKKEREFFKENPQFVVYVTAVE